MFAVILFAQKCSPSKKFTAKQKQSTEFSRAFKLILILISWNTYITYVCMCLMCDIAHDGWLNG